MTKFIPWYGGGTPKEITKDTKLKIYYRDGGVVGRTSFSWVEDKLWIWDNVDPENDVVAYEILE